MYDPQLGRWHTPDVLGELRYNESPYCYVGNNPISRIDPDGRLWADKESRKEARQLKRDMRKAIADTKSFVAWGSINKNDGKARIQDLKAGIKEVKAMGKNKEYTFSANPNAQYGETTLNGTRSVSLNYNLVNNGSPDAGIRAHEFKHGYQIMTGELIDAQTWYDKGDEVAAYQRYLSTSPGLTGLGLGYTFLDKKGNYNYVTQMNGFTNNVIGKIAERGMPLYNDLPDGPLNMYTPLNPIPTPLFNTNLDIPLY
jgi:uncharacterized protein RhaS with RHS repeats